MKESGKDISGSTDYASKKRRETDDMEEFQEKKGKMAHIFGDDEEEKETDYMKRPFQDPKSRLRERGRVKMMMQRNRRFTQIRESNHRQNLGVFQFPC